MLSGRSATPTRGAHAFFDESLGPETADASLLDRFVRGGDSAADDAAPDASLRDLQWALHEEIDRLPENHRAAVVLCYLEGLTHEEAARRLGWPLGSVKGRLARAREQLRDRLVRRGLALA